MKFKKGAKVEVMNKKEVPSSWRVAEILSGNGHMYHVKYDYYPGIESQHKAVTASRNSLRPCQPLLQGEEFIVGDIVEVFYEYAWKTAAILKVLRGKTETKSKKISLRHYLVRLLGCSAESIVDGSKIRTKQTWHDDKWIPFEKSYWRGEDITPSKPSTSVFHQNVNLKIPLSNARSKKNCIIILDESRFMESQHDSRLRKRVPPYDSSINGTDNTEKLRAIEIDGRKQRLVVSPLPSGYDEMVQAEIGDVPWTRSSQSNSSDSNASSIASCSVTNNLDMPPSMVHLSLETDSVCSDAESCNNSGFERKSSSLIRRLELQAYHRTLEALYASGPLSWEQQSMLTNLRMMLHISNDEHLMEVKNLISAKTAGGMIDLLPSLKLMPQFAASIFQCFWTILSSSTFKLMQELFTGLLADEHLILVLQDIQQIVQKCHEILVTI